MSETTALAALKCLATTGVVSRLKASSQTLRGLDHLHVARGVVLALAGLPDTLVERVATAAGAGSPPAHCVALRLPSPDHVDLRGDMLDLLVVAHPGDDGSWQRAADELAADLARWSGNHVHTLVAAPDDATRSDPGELHTAPWRLAPGTPPGALPLTDDTTPHQEELGPRLWRGDRRTCGGVRRHWGPLRHTVRRASSGTRKRLTSLTPYTDGGCGLTSLEAASTAGYAGLVRTRRIP